METTLDFYIYGGQVFSQWVRDTEMKTNTVLNCTGGNLHWLYSFDKSNPLSIFWLDTKEMENLPTNIISFTEFKERYADSIVIEMKTFIEGKKKKPSQKQSTYSII
jgi:phenolic acid decarboxylase